MQSDMLIPTLAIVCGTTIALVAIVFGTVKNTLVARRAPWTRTARWPC